MLRSASVRRAKGGRGHGTGAKIGFGDILYLFFVVYFVYFCLFL